MRESVIKIKNKQLHKLLYKTSKELESGKIDSSINEDAANAEEEINAQVENEMECRVSLLDTEETQSLIDELDQELPSDQESLARVQMEGLEYDNNHVGIVTVEDGPMAAGLGIDEDSVNTNNIEDKGEASEPKTRIGKGRVDCIMCGKVGLLVSSMKGHLKSKGCLNAV